MKNLAFIPARSGSKRVPNKNILELNGKPLLFYTIDLAIKSKCFDEVFLVTDSQEYAELGIKYGAKVLELRPQNISGDNSPDIDWVNWMFDLLRDKNIDFDTFSILRPTSPFRSVDMLVRAFKIFLKSNAHSLRAVEEVNQHPGKMWIIKNEYLLPILPYDINNVPWHNNQKSKLPKVYVQNASLEIAWKSTVENFNSISGSVILPFLTEGYEGFDINTQNDFLQSKEIIKNYKNG